MPKNKLIRAGVVVVAGSALLWLGAVVLSRLQDMFLWIGLVGVLLIVVGVFMEIKKNHDAKKEPGDPPPAS